MMPGAWPGLGGERHAGWRSDVSRIGDLGSPSSQDTHSELECHSFSGPGTYRDGATQHARPGTSRGRALIGREGRGPRGHEGPTRQVSSKDRTYSPSGETSAPQAGRERGGGLPRGSATKKARKRRKVSLNWCHRTPDGSRRMSTGQGVQKPGPS